MNSIFSFGKSEFKTAYDITANIKNCRRLDEDISEICVKNVDLKMKICHT